MIRLGNISNEEQMFFKIFLYLPIIPDCEKEGLLNFILLMGVCVGEAALKPGRGRAGAGARELSDEVIEAMICHWGALRI